MSGADPSDSNHSSAEARAEELMERLASDASRLIGRVAGRAREELDDILAEARSQKERWQGPSRG